MICMVSKSILINNNFYFLYDSLFFCIYGNISAGILSLLFGLSAIPKNVLIINRIRLFVELFKYYFRHYNYNPISESKNTETTTRIRENKYMKIKPILLIPICAPWTFFMRFKRSFSCSLSKILPQSHRLVPVREMFPSHKERMEKCVVVGRRNKKQCVHC